MIHLLSGVHSLTQENRSIGPIAQFLQLNVAIHAKDAADAVKVKLGRDSMITCQRKPLLRGNRL